MRENITMGNFRGLFSVIVRRGLVEILPLLFCFGFEIRGQGRTFRGVVALNIVARL